MRGETTPGETTTFRTRTGGAIDATEGEDGATTFSSNFRRNQSSPTAKR
jgi:hypothetical protein